MLKNYLTIAIRNLLKHKSYAAINVIGLAVGLAGCFLIMLYVRFEMSYESMHAQRENIYRVVTRWMSEDVEMAQVWSPTGLAPKAAAKFPEIKAAARFIAWDEKALMQHSGNELPRERLALADQSFFETFSFELVNGNPQTALEAPLTMVIAESIARRAFPNENPLGKIIRFDDRFDIAVTGVFKDVPANSHLQFSYLLSFVTLKDFLPNLGREPVLESFSSWQYSTYFLIPHLRDRAAFELRLTDFFREQSKNDSKTLKLTLQPLGEIHFTQGLRGDSANGDLAYVYAFSGVAAFILFIACFNFMNLATARALNRAKEVGVRKVIGAFRWQLIAQFLSEAVVLGLAALGLSFVLLELLMFPVFKKIIGADVSFFYATSPELLLAMIAAGILTGLLAGGYPAFYLSSFVPSQVLKSKATTGGKSTLRKFLLVLQFGIASLLIIGTLVVFEQMNFMKRSRLGFQKEQVVCLEAPAKLLESYNAFKQNLLRHNSIAAVTRANSVPGREHTHFPYLIRQAEGGQITVSINTLLLDEDYLATLGVEMAEGRNFSREIASDATENYLINEAAARKLGLANPVGMDMQVFNGQRQTGKIVGVVKDFHYASLRREIEPLAMWMNRGGGLVAIRMSAADIAASLKLIEQEWSRLAPAYPFVYSFLDDDFARLYEAEEKLSAVLGAFASLAIFIACLGLLGLSAYIAEQRTKEIGIRKVLGASVRDIVLLFSQDFLKFVIIAFIVACPLAYIAVNQWLQGFAYRIELGPGLFAAAGLLAFLCAALTVSVQALKAALANPIETLRYE